MTIAMLTHMYRNTRNKHEYVVGTHHVDVITMLQ